MPISRHAIIVVSPNCPGQKPLPGASNDARQWKSFLSSPEGGAWKPQEITVLTDPTKATLTVELAVRDDEQLDYTLLAFSGHGECVDTNHGREARLYLSSTDYLTETGFTLSAKRELLILDACRELRDERLIKAHISEAVEAQFSMGEDQSTRLARSRELFDAAIAGNPLGRSIVYSCGINEIASDRPSFTKVLIEEAADMAMKEEYARVVTIWEAFPRAETVVRNFKQPQNPVYEAGRRVTHLPFAVSV
jgi:caspase domain-containing protein